MDMERSGLLKWDSSANRSLHFQRRLALVKYLLHQVRSSRNAYYPDGCGGGLGETAPSDVSGGSAATIAALGAEGLAESLSPSVRVSDLLDSLASRTPAGDTDESPHAAAPTWGALLRGTAQGSRQPQEGLELYLCERLLPLLDDGIAALCKYIEKLQADEQQLALHQSRMSHEERQHSHHESGRMHKQEQESPRLLLGQDLHDRFDPLVWLGQYLLRQGKAACEFANAKELPNQEGWELAERSSQRRVRGEHIRIAELPLYEAVAAEVRDERGWRALEALQSETELLYKQVKRQLVQAVQEQEAEKVQELQQQEKAEDKQTEQQQEKPKREHDKEAQGDTFDFSAEDLAVMLEAIDSAWGLPSERGFLAAVAGGGAGEESDIPSCPSGSDSYERRSLRPQAAFEPLSEHKEADKSTILGACNAVALEVADASDLKFAELWRFLACCLEACPQLKREVFAYALHAAKSAYSPGKPTMEVGDLEGSQGSARQMPGKGSYNESQAEGEEAES